MDECKKMVLVGERCSGLVHYGFPERVTCPEFVGDADFSH